MAAHAAGNWHAMGVDLGSTTAKTVILDQGGVLAASRIVQMGAVSRAGVRSAMEQAMTDAGLTASDIARTVSTGYGRRLIEIADNTFTEITCHARGAHHLWPGVRLVIDIGGQDSKAIAVDENGFVDHFAMNDRCASGTGRFFEVLARALEVEIEEVGPLAMQGSRNLEISSMCATFAETEVISLLAQGEEKADIAASVHRAVAARTVGLVAQVGKHTPVVMTGGVAKNEAAVRFISERLDVEVEVPQDPQLSGAYGAALIARDEFIALQTGESAREPSDVDMARGRSGAVPDCATCEVQAAQTAQFPDPAETLSLTRS